MEELEAQLEFERLKREKREAELDECRNEIAHLINTLRSFEEKRLHPRVRVLDEEKSICKLEFFSIDHRVNLVPMTMENHHQLRRNEQNVSRKKLERYLCVEVLSIVKRTFFAFVLDLQYIN